MRKTRIGLVQINVDFHSEYLPYSAGILQAYAQMDKDVRSNFEFISPTYKRLPQIDPIVEKLKTCQIVGFSTYVWNTEYSLKIARALKEINPNILILFGGPNAPDHAEKFLKDHTCVDLIMYGEGEFAFQQFLKNYMKGNWVESPSLRYLEKNTGKYMTTPRAPRIESLDNVPSPYLAGVFDEIMKSEPNQVWNALWETNRGCPFSCTYCDWGSATEMKINKFSMEQILREVEWFQKNKIEYLMCCDANFGILKRDVEIAEALAASKNEHGYPKIFAATFTKNATERSYQIAQILLRTGLIRGYTVSTQSVDEQTLINVRRDNISQESFNILQARLNRDKLPTYTDLIIGLPGETYETFIKGVSAVISRGQYNKIYFIILQILPNSQMASPAYREKHGFVTVQSPQKNLHERVKEDPNEVTEYQELVIATKTLPKEEWRKTVSFAWMVSLLYFNKLLHIPLTILSKLGGIDIKEVTENFLNVNNPVEYPFITRINKLFADKTAAIQNGEIEYCSSDFWLKIWWQPDKFAFMEACKDLDQFYKESEKILKDVLKKKQDSYLKQILKESLKLNRHLVRSPFKPRPNSINLNLNIYDFYSSILEQNTTELKEGDFRYFIHKFDEKWDSIEDWCRKVVWYGNKTSSYLSTCYLENASGSKNGEGSEFEPAALKPYFYA